MDENNNEIEETELEVKEKLEILIKLFCGNRRCTFQ